MRRCPFGSSSNPTAKFQVLCNAAAERTLFFIYGLRKSGYCSGSKLNEVSATEPATDATGRICKVVVHGGGDLDDMEAVLGGLGVTPTPQMVGEVLQKCREEAVPRRILGFFHWCLKSPGFQSSAHLFNSVIDFFAKKNDLRALELLLARMRDVGLGLGLEIQTFAHVTERLVKAGRDKQAAGLFKRFQGPEITEAFRIVLTALCAHGFPERAEILWNQVRSGEEEFGSDLNCFVQESLVRGWSVKGDFKRARRALDDMKINGFKPGLLAYNSLLDCVCRVEKNPSRLMAEGHEILCEMCDVGGPPNQASFNGFISRLCKMGSVENAHKLFVEMESFGCSPNWATYALLIRALFLKGRLSDGDRLLDQMIEGGLRPDAKMFRVFVGVLCGTERADHAISLLSKMEPGCEGQGPIYDLLIEKLGRNGKFEQAQQLWNEAKHHGLSLQVSLDFLDPSKTEVYKPVRPKKPKKPETRAKKKPKVKLQYIKKKKRQSLRKKGLVVDKFGRDSSGNFVLGK